MTLIPGQLLKDCFIHHTLLTKRTPLTTPTIALSTATLMYCPANCIHIQIFDIFLAFDSNLLPFSSPDIGQGAAVFQVSKICAFNQSNALVLIVK